MTKETLEAMRIPELRALFTKTTGETTKTPNKVFLIRRILEIQTANRRSKRARTRAKKVPRDATNDELAALQARYAEAVGRPTGSSDVPYIKWKIRMAKKGHVRLGPVREAMGPCQILPLRLPTTAVEAFDTAYRRAGYKTRISAIREALRAFLEGLGDSDAASRFL